MSANENPGLVLYQDTHPEEELQPKLWTNNAKENVYIIVNEKWLPMMNISIDLWDKDNLWRYVVTLLATRYPLLDVYSVHYQLIWFS